MVFDMLRDMLAEILGREESEITLSSELRDDLEASDGEIMEVMEAIAGELGFRYEQTHLAKIDTVGQLVSYIASVI